MVGLLVTMTIALHHLTTVEMTELVDNYVEFMLIKTLRADTGLLCQSRS